jgi:hypothetical protein
MYSESQYYNGHDACLLISQFIAIDAAAGAYGKIL